MGGHYTTAASQPAIMTREHLEQCRHLLGDVPEWVEREANIRSVESQNMAEREVLGQHVSTAPGCNMRVGMTGCDYDGVGSITAPATPEAQQWAGWGTALKPALEPITMARKPLQGTVAANVLGHGTGGLNVDGCRVGTRTENESGWSKTGSKAGENRAMSGANYAREAKEEIGTGRWPANLIHDGSNEVLALFPESVSRTSAAVNRINGVLKHGGENARPSHGTTERVTSNEGFDDAGSAARFFYTPKADSSERRQSKHPTVKPLDLIRYLVRMVTPEGGVVLDPFLGSGTLCEAARAEHCLSIGIELDAAYCADAVERLRQGVLF